MKKVLALVLTVIATGFFSINIGQNAKAATPEADQISYPPYYTNPPGYKSYTVKNTEVYVPCQKFKPSKSILASYLDLPLGYGFNEPASLLIHQAIGSYGNEVGDSIATYTANVSMEFEVSQWQRFDAPAETAVDTNNFYWMCLATSSVNLKWYYTDPSEYDRGFLLLKYRNGVPVTEANQDFGFRTFGYNPDTPTPADDQTGNQGTNGTTGISSEAPSANVTADIAKPTELKAEYTATDPAKRGIKLTWKASTTTDIDGYMLFRSETKGKAYTKTGQVDKSKLEYLDQTVQAGKTYYYIARAYKGSSQSYSSNEASAAVPADAGPSLPTGLKVSFFSDTKIKVGWSKNPETNISEYQVSIYEGEKLIKTDKLPADKVSNLFSDLKAGTAYKIKLVALDSNGKMSPPAEINQTTLPAIITPGPTFEMTILTWILSGIIVLMLGALFFLIYRRKQRDKKAVF